MPASHSSWAWFPWMIVMSRSQPRMGYSLIEIVVVIAILTITTALLLSAVQRVRSAAARATCADRLRQLGLACHSWEAAKGAFPPGTGSEGRDPYPFLNWHARVLPYLEHEPLWRRIEAA